MKLNWLARRVIGDAAPPPEGPRSPEWPSVRRAHLAKYPTCAACGGTEQVEVHHKLPFHLHPELELDPNNLITLCEHPSRNCHFVFGHYHDWKAYNPAVDAMTAQYLQGQAQRPTA